MPENVVQPPLGALSRRLGSLLQLPQPKREPAPVYRWIMYLHAPGGLGGDLKRVTSLSEAKYALVEYGRASGYHQDLTVYGTYGPTAVLYPYSEEDWAEAERMRDVGCPFDYPTYEVTSGPRGGVKVTRA